MAWQFMQQLLVILCSESENLVVDYLKSIPKELPPSPQDQFAVGL